MVSQISNHRATIADPVAHSWIGMTDEVRCDHELADLERAQRDIV